ncbi:hypothetical protein [Virgibacillus ainsalahensis]
MEDLRDNWPNYFVAGGMFWHKFLFPQSEKPLLLPGAKEVVVRKL